LPWIFLTGGLLLTVATALIAEQLVRRRRLAEQDAQTIAGLYERLDGLYAEQRTIAETLQRALLPSHNPSIPELEIASRYVAGADGVDIGGDWYTFIEVGERHFSFVVGDVSGRGISAASVMAKLRFTIRAYLLEGHPPEVVLAMCSRQLDISGDGHFATVLVGVGDLDTRQVTLSNAGHFNPLLVSGSVSEYVEAAVGLPLGIAPCSYDSKAIVMPAGSALVVFTDGLVERRGENLDVGLERLARMALTPAATLEDLVERVVSQSTEGGSEDDIAVVAFRWRNA
jgi:serine phosphatase RsbU (regulator of sigma subunit)